MQKRALILGINGQDGSYLADLLVQAQYDVHGVVRRSSQPNLWRIVHLLDRVTIHQGDLLDFGSIHRVFWKILPEEVYNEADQDHVGYSTATPDYSAQVTYGAVANLLELVNMVKSPKVRLFQPLSATMFGDAPGPQSLDTPFNPQSPYAVSKLAAYYLCKHYREKHGVAVTTAILYNHDSVRRQGDYLLHKICKGCVKIAHHDQDNLDLTDIQAKVDIGHAADYMSAIYRRMTLESPSDCIIGTGQPNTIHSLIDIALRCNGLLYDPYVWLKNQDDRYSTAHKTDKWLSPAMADDYLVPTKTIAELIKELCDHYTTALYGGK